MATDDSSRVRVSSMMEYYGITEKRIAKMEKELMAIKIILILTALIMVGCSVFPSTTTISATTKATSDAVPTVKVQQHFKWGRE